MLPQFRLMFEVHILQNKLAASLNLQQNQSIGDFVDVVAASLAYNFR